jgi:hypothetical protein
LILKVNIIRATFIWKKYTMATSKKRSVLARKIPSNLIPLTNDINSLELPESTNYVNTYIDTTNNSYDLKSINHEGNIITVLEPDR